MMGLSARNRDHICIYIYMSDYVPLLQGLDDKEPNTAHEIFIKCVNQGERRNQPSKHIRSSCAGALQRPQAASVLRTDYTPLDLVLSYLPIFRLEELGFS